MTNKRPQYDIRNSNQNIEKENYSWRGQSLNYMLDLDNEKPENTQWTFYSVKPSHFMCSMSYILKQAKHLVLRDLTIRGLHSSIPVILSGRMICRWSTLPSLRVEIFAKSALVNSEVVPEKTAPSQLGDKEVDNVFE